MEKPIASVFNKKSSAEEVAAKGFDKKYAGYERAKAHGGGPGSRVKNQAENSPRTPKTPKSDDHSRFPLKKKQKGEGLSGVLNKITSFINKISPRRTAGANESFDALASSKHAGFKAKALEAKEKGDMEAALENMKRAKVVESMAALVQAKRIGNASIASAPKGTLARQGITAQNFPCSSNRVSSSSSSSSNAGPSRCVSGGNRFS